MSKHGGKPVEKATNPYWQSIRAGEQRSAGTYQSCGRTIQKRRQQPVEPILTSIYIVMPTDLKSAD
jgi:hypothetical protein